LLERPAAGNVQALAAPRGVPLWVSDVLPGSTHDLTVGHYNQHRPISPASNDRPTKTTKPALCSPCQFSGGRYSACE